MKTNYKSLRRAAARYRTAVEKRDRVARMRLGVLTGKPDIARENAELEAAQLDLVAMTRHALAHGARIGSVAAAVECCWEASEEVNYAIVSRMDSRR